MKINKIILVLLFLVLFSPWQAMAQPKIEIDNPVYSFEPVPEGAAVTHEFVIKNTGDTLLTINDVRPP